jgi:hypothetical protein
MIAASGTRNAADCGHYNRPPLSTRPTCPSLKKLLLTNVWEMGRVQIKRVPNASQHGDHQNQKLKR